MGLNQYSVARESPAATTVRQPEVSPGNQLIANNLEPYKDPIKVLDLVLDFAKRHGDKIARVALPVITKFLQNASAELVDQFLHAAINVRKYGPIVGIVVNALQQIDRNALPAHAPTLTDVANRLLDQKDGMTSDQAHVFARIAHDRLNPKDIDSGNCGGIASELQSYSRVESNRRRWDAISGGETSLTRNTFKPLKQVMIRANPDERGLVPMESAKAIFGELSRATAGHHKMARLSHTDAVAPDPSTPNVPPKFDRATDEAVDRHSRNAVRLEDGTLAIIDGQEGKAVVGEEAILQYLRNHKSSSRINPRFVVTDALILK